MSDPSPARIGAIADDRDRALDPRSVPSARLSAFVGVLILGVISAVLAMVIAFKTDFHGTTMKVVVSVWLVAISLLTVRAWLWPAVAYRYTSYRVSQRGLIIRRGVLWRSVATVPTSRIQHTDVSQGPLQRPFGLSTLTVHTAGTHFAAVPLSGLAKETAEAIRDYLIDDNGASGDGV